MGERFSERLLHHNAALRRQDLAGRRATGDHEGAEGLLRTWQRDRIGADGYPLDYTGAKKLNQNGR